MAIKETDNTTKYTNLAIESPTGATEIIQFLSGIGDEKIEFNASEYDAVIGFFQGRGYERQAAESLAFIILRQAKIDNVPVFQVIDSLSKVAPVTLSQLVTEILNSNRYKTSVLGFKNERTTIDHISRNIKA